MLRKYYIYITNTFKLLTTYNKKVTITLIKIEKNTSIIIKKKIIIKVAIKNQGEKMASCLGLFIQDNLIKYAKISKENENIKVENYGIKFYEDELEKNIEQIVDIIFIFKTPISFNLANENYTNCEVFSLLSDIV